MANPVTFGRVKYVQADTNVHTAWALRPGIYGDGPGVGVPGYEDFRVMPRQAGSNMQVDVGKTGVGLMEAFVPGSSRTGQGIYECTNIDWTSPTTSSYSAQITVDVASNASGNPRIDMVVLEVLDAQHSGASNVQQIRVVAGTATVGATLENRTGAAAQPANTILLADILVPNGAAAIDNGAGGVIRDRRPWISQGVTTLASLDEVTFQFHPAVANVYVSITPTATDTFQSAVAAYLPRRIVGATKLRWAYQQTGVSAATSNYNIGIMDASGRLLVSTGATAFAGATGSRTAVTATITSTTLEAGAYFVVFGLAAMTGSSAVGFRGFDPTTNSSQVFPGVGGIAYRLTSGGTTLPTSIQAMLAGGGSDVNAAAGAATSVPVPVISLSTT